jgi:maltose alpha-D-glucosyltransferase/alpha-amylase
MQWSADRNAGFSRANPQRLYLPVIVDPEYHYETVNVEAQQSNASSLLWWTKRLIALRKRFHAFGRGTIEFLYPDNRKVLAFLRCYQDETILIVANMSRFVQYASLDLSRFKDHVPVELFGLTQFPRVGAEPFFVTLGPHAFYWFQLRPAQRTEEVWLAGGRARAEAQVSQENWDLLLHDGDARGLEHVLPRYITAQRWFQGKGRALRSVRVTDVLPTTAPNAEQRIALVDVQYVEEQTETYVLPLARLTGDAAQELIEHHPAAVIAQIDSGSVIVDATYLDDFRQSLLDAVQGRRRITGLHGDVQGIATGHLRKTVDGLEDRTSRTLAPSRAIHHWCLAATSSSSCIAVSRRDAAWMSRSASS